jgi:ABC-type branched-subunit amino acid transport system ATPase component
MMTLEPRIENAAMQQASSRTSSFPILGSDPYLLKAHGLKKSFGGQIVLDDVDLELRQGEVILLRGENGSGKTTLLNILTGNLEPDAGTIHYLADGTPRSYRFPRCWWQELNPFDHFTPEFVAREGIGRTWQDVRLFGSQSLRDNISVAEPSHPGENPILALLTPSTSSRHEEKINRDADAMLARLGLAERVTSSASKISLGQSKRVAIARAVAAGAKILFLDEPLAGLDRKGISDVLSLFQTLVLEHDITLVIVEHVFNQPHLRHLITTDWLLARGRLTIATPNPSAHSSLRTATVSPEWVKSFASADTEAVNEPLPRGALLTRIRRSNIPWAPPNPVLEISNLVVKRGARTVIGLNNHDQVSGFNLTLFKGEIAILQAPNGWGKSSLFGAITGLIAADQGEIYLEGRNLAGLPTWKRVKQGLRALPADRNTFSRLRTREALRLAGKPSSSICFGPLANRPCSSLSGGERQRVALAAVTAGKFCVYDEPFLALDSHWARETISALQASQFESILILSPSVPHNQNKGPL